MRFLSAFLAFLVTSFSSSAQRDFDVLHYRFNIELNDLNDSITGMAAITVLFNDPTSSVEFDLHAPGSNGKGMIAYKVEGPGFNSLSQVDKESRIRLSLQDPSHAGDTATFLVHYRGIPADGLIISKNKFGRRTFFSDNWPDRARHWLPCVDDVSDKASVEFLITAPNHYQVISNGELVEVTDLAGNRRLTHWREESPLPTKVMVIGVAEFAVQYLPNTNGATISSWVFPENRETGFHDYAAAAPILQYLINYIGPYPFAKLANVQSKTIFGGMENASAIFYFENSVTGRQDEEGLIAHEIAHQWFGNSATEQHYAHLWLSEGFATYLSHLYLESKYGRDTLLSMLKDDRDNVIGFARSNHRPVVDSVSTYMELLNANSYQKGGWVLHMLRNKIGDQHFRQVIRTYYGKFAFGNATTADFQRIAEQQSGMNLDTFFRQWLYTPGIPRLQLTWNYDHSGRKLNITVTQLQQTVFDLPLEVSYTDAAGKTKMMVLQIDKKSTSLSIDAPGKIVAVTPDPNVLLLAEFN